MSLPKKMGDLGLFQLASIDADADRLASLRVLSNPDRLKLIRGLLTEVAVMCGCSDKTVRDIVLAVDEACQNIIRHAYAGDVQQEIFLDFVRTSSSLVIYIFDFAEAVDISKIRSRELDDLRPGGLGTHFISECMDVSEYLSPPKGVGNLLRMEKIII